MKKLVSSGWMRWRNSHGWALAAGVALAFVLILTCHTGYAVADGAGMSAPVKPLPSIESAPLAKIWQTSFDWQGHALGPAGFSPVPTAIRAEVSAWPVPASAPAHYGPLHRRPPPVLS